VHPDIAVVGGGITGAAVARELARAGRRVVLLERGEIGREASWAAAGLLTPIHLADYPAPLADLCVRAADLWPAFAADLRDVEFRTNGVLMLARDEHDRQAIDAITAFRRSRGQPVEPVDTPRELESVLDPALRGGVLIPGIAQVRNNRVPRALLDSAGIDVRPDCEVTGFMRVPGRITGVKTSRGDVIARETILCSGAWGADLLDAVGVRIHLHPVRGQIVLLDGPPDLVRRVFLWGDRYVVPRADGKLLVGTTVEESGFDKRTTASGVADILARAIEVAPGLAGLPVVTSWAGLRPATRDRLPYLGRPPGLDGLVLATGMYRNGILLAPLVARLVAELLAGSPSLDTSPFRIDR
jgi:glycine oxidase